MPNASESMEAIRPIDFTTALVRLQEMIGSEVKVVVNHHGHFFGCCFQGQLLCVQTLPPDDTAVRVVLKAGQGLVLDPDDLDTFQGGGEGNGKPWLEFHLAFGASLQIEMAEQAGKS